MRLAAIVCLAWLACGCPSTGVSLAVDVQTGLLPGREFGFVSLELAPGSIGSDTLPMPRTAGTAASVADTDYARGRRITSFDELAPGVYTVRAMLRRPVSSGSPDGGRELIARRVIVSLSANRVLRIPLTPDCLDVQCPAPAGSPGFTACINGRCVDPRCDAGDPATFEFCCDAAVDDCTVPTICAAPTDCAGVVSCTDPACFEGVCTRSETPDDCAPGEYCSVVEGLCVSDGPGPDAGDIDGGAPDAPAVPDAAGEDAASDDAPRMDVASLDAASPDAASLDAASLDAPAPPSDAAVVIDAPSDAPRPDAFDPCDGVSCPLDESCSAGVCRIDPFEISGGGGAINGVAVLPGGDLVFVGHTSSPLALGGACGSVGPVTAGSDIVIARIDDHSGDCVWARRYGGPGQDEPRSVAVDASGNLYVTGLVSSAVSLGGATLTYAGDADLFLASYTPAGAHAWSHVRGSTGYDSGIGVAIDGAEVLFTGAFSGSITFDRLLTATGLDAFVTRLTAGGAFLSSSSAGGAGDEWGRGIVADAAGSFYVVGSFSGSIDLDGPGGWAPEGSIGDEDVFVVSYTDGYTPRWRRSFGSRGRDWGRAIALSSDGSQLAIGGFFGPGSVRIGTTTRMSTGAEDGFVAVLTTSAGTPVWDTTIGASAPAASTDSAIGLAYESSGNLLVAGLFSSTSRIGPTGSTCSMAGSERDPFVARLNSADGACLGSSVRVGAAMEDYFYAVVPCSDGRTCAGGTLGGQILLSATRF